MNIPYIKSVYFSILKNKKAIHLLEKKQSIWLMNMLIPVDDYLLLLLPRKPL